MSNLDGTGPKTGRQQGRCGKKQNQLQMISWEDTGNDPTIVVSEEIEG